MAERMGDLVGTEWDTLMSGIQTSFQTKEQQESDVSALFLTLKRTLEKKSALHWHIQSFERYIKENINPIGLRIQIFPTLDNITSQMKKAWENTLNECSKNLMRLLQEEYRRQILTIDEDVKLIYVQLTPLKDLPLYSEQEKSLKENLEEHSKNILRKKEKKYWRDKNAFTQGRAYKWNNYRRQPRNKTQSGGKYNERPGNYSSDSSASQTSGAEQPSTRRRGPFQKSRTGATQAENQNTQGEGETTGSDLNQIQESEHPVTTTKQHDIFTRSKRKEQEPTTKATKGFLGKPTQKPKA